MKIKWKMSIGYPTAIREGEIEVDQEVLDQWTEKAQQEYIDELVWQAALECIDTSWEVKEEQGK